MNGPRVGWARRWRTPLWLGALAFCLYLPGFWWGAPEATGPDRIHGWAVDDETPLGPLAQINNILHPQAVQNLGYPLMHSFLVVGAYVPYLGWLKLTGAWAGPSGGEYPYGFRDPVSALRGLSRIGHLLSVVLGVVVVLGAWAAARAMWDPLTAVLAGLITTVSYPMFYYSRTGNVDVPMMAFAAIAIAAYAHAIRRPPTPAVALVLGAAGGFALATKEQIVGLFLAVGPVVLILHFLHVRRSGLRGWAAWKVPVLAAGALLLAFGLGSGLFVDPTRFFAHVAHMQERVALVRLGEIEYLATFPRTWAGHADLIRLLAELAAHALTLPGLVLGVAGVAFAIWREPRSVLLALPAVTYLLLLFFAARAGQLRYLMPATFVIGLFAAWLLAQAWASRLGAVRTMAVLAGGLVMGLGLLRGVDLTWAMLRDGRYEAARWIADRADPGDRAEYFGPAYKLPALPPSMEVAQATPHLGPLRPERRDAAAAAEIAAGWVERRPRFVVIAPDWSSRVGEPFPASLPPETFAALESGALGYRLAATFQTPALLPWVRRPPLDSPLVNIPVRIFMAAPEGAP